LSVVKGRRPTIPPEFPATLKPLIIRGWDQEPKTRPSLREFRVVLRAMVIEGSVPVASGKGTAQTDNRVSMIQQSSEVAKVNLPMPMISLKWNTSSEV